MRDQNVLRKTNMLQCEEKWLFILSIQQWIKLTAHSKRGKKQKEIPIKPSIDCKRRTFKPYNSCGSFKTRVVMPAKQVCNI